MSLMDKIKSMFSGGSDASDDSHAGHSHARDQEDLAVGDVPPPPVDPLGSPMPGAPPADRDERP